MWLGKKSRVVTQEETSEGRNPEYLQSAFVHSSRSVQRQNWEESSGFSRAKVLMFSISRDIRMIISLILGGLGACCVPLAAYLGYLFGPHHCSIIAVQMYILTTPCVIGHCYYLHCTDGELRHREAK
ncbi:unnamed protein product [Eretmochelys imbricata]